MGNGTLLRRGPTSFLVVSLWRIVFAISLASKLQDILLIYLWEGREVDSCLSKLLATLITYHVCHIFDVKGTRYIVHIFEIVQGYAFLPFLFPPLMKYRLCHHSRQRDIFWIYYWHYRMQGRGFILFLLSLLLRNLWVQGKVKYCQYIWVSGRRGFMPVVVPIFITYPLYRRS